MLGKRLLRYWNSSEFVLAMTLTKNLTRVLCGEEEGISSWE
jgi:hypothetical protein